MTNTKNAYFYQLSSLLLLQIWCILIKSTWQQTDTYSSYFSNPASAMDIDYTNGDVYIANANNQNIYKMKADNSFSLFNYNFATSFKADISTLSISSNTNYILAGGRDYTARAFNTITKATLCTWEQLRGDIISSVIASDNDQYAIGSNEGYLYYGKISDCSIKTYNKTDFRLKGVQIITSRSEIWISDGVKSIIVLNYLTDTATSFSLPTQGINSLMHLNSQSLIGACTQRAFYLINYSQSIQFTIMDPSVITKGCRIFKNSASEYILTVIPYTSRYQRSGTSVSPLWTIWRISTTPTITADHYHQQLNGGRYAATTILQDAGAFLLTSARINVVSIAQSVNPYFNWYLGNMGFLSCDTGFSYTILACLKCNWQSTRNFCSLCSSSDCTSCQVKSYFVSATKTCSPCPLTCHQCTSATVCTACIGGYTLVGNNCIIGNITGCAQNYLNGSSVSRCHTCIDQFLGQNNLTCKHCQNIHPGCIKCTTQTCLRCEPNFVIMSVWPYSCQLCALSIQGCAGCMNQTYCDTCYEAYPYFDYPTPTTRNCIRQCDYVCTTCLHLAYDTCVSCDNNRTLTGTTCVCKPQFPFEDPILLQCMSCDYYIVDCDTCSSQTFCTACDTNVYLDPVNATHQNCKACNYTCLTCTTTWFQCTTCDASMNRIINSNKQCVCMPDEYFQLAPNVLCEACITHIPFCLKCYNGTYCRTCDSGYYVQPVVPNSSKCSPCLLPCLQCFGSGSHCTKCMTGRILNNILNTCQCMEGYYPDGLACNSCHPILGACLQCNDNVTCLTCWSNNYFKMVGTQKTCDLCQSSCLTCAVWTHICATCDPLANRVLNTLTQQCDCMVGFTATSGRCLNCSAKFTYCTSCNQTICFSCQTGYSLAFGGLKCMDCATTYPGCLLCINGVCGDCDEDQGYQLSYSKCICQPGRYHKDLKCLEYKMGSVIQRLFNGYGKYSQNINTNLVTISIYFRAEGIKVPNGIVNSVKLTINGQVLTNFSVAQQNTTFVFTFMPNQSLPMAQIIIQFKNNTIYDLDEYGPKQKVFTFQKNIFKSSSYQLSETFSSVYQTYIIPAIRWVSTILIILGCADLVMTLLFTVHVLPAFLLMNLSTPMPLQNVLQKMIKINFSNLFSLTDAQLSFEQFGQNLKYLDFFGATGGLIKSKAIDLIFLGSILALYGIIFPKLLAFVPQGKLSKIWQYKFILKRYSTLACTILSFMPVILTSTLLDIIYKQYDPSQKLSTGISYFIICFAGCFIFVHSLALKQTQFDQNYKNEDTYLGTSIMEIESVYFIMSSLTILVWPIIMIGLLSPIYNLPIMVIIILWQIYYFRFWSNFPHKFMFFFKLFYSIFFLLYVLAFLVFCISENYSLVSIQTLQLIGLCTMVNILVLFALSCVQTIFQFCFGFFRFYKVNQNFVSNSQEQIKQEHLENQSEMQSMRTTLQKPETNLTNKQKHMKKFKQEHQRTTLSKMLISSKSIKQSYAGRNMNNTSRMTQRLKGSESSLRLTGMVGGIGEFSRRK